MKKFIKTIVINTTLNAPTKIKGEGRIFSSYQLAKGYREFLILIKRYVKDLVLNNSRYFFCFFWVQRILA